jgi:mannose-1-phosphate guanylyltransferase
MIVRLVEQLAQGGVTDVVLALGFKPEPFTTAFPDGRHGDVTVHYAVEPEPLDTAGAVAFAARSAGVADTFVVANGDVITDLDVARLLTEHRRIGVDATIHLTPVEDPSAFGVVELGDGDLIRRFVEKPRPGDTDSNLINAGTYVLEPAVLDLIPEGRRVSIERDTFQRLVERARMAGVATTDYWLDTGRPEQYLQANLDLIRGVRGSAPAGVAPGASVSSDAIVIESVVAADAVVEAAATVADSVLLPGAHVEAGADVARSIVAGRVGAAAVITDSVIGAGYCVPAAATVHSERLPAPE